MIATPEMLASLEPGEWLVRCLRDGWTIPPDHIARVRASHALRDLKPMVGKYHGHEPNEAQRECLEGSP